MDLDIGKIINLVGIGMSVAQSFRGKHTGAEKEAIAVAEVQRRLPQVENALGLDFVNDEALNNLLDSYIAARVALTKGIAAAKGLNPHEGLIIPGHTEPSGPLPGNG